MVFAIGDKTIAKQSVIVAVIDMIFCFICFLLMYVACYKNSLRRNEKNVNNGRKSVRVILKEKEV